MSAALIDRARKEQAAALSPPRLEARILSVIKSGKRLEALATEIRAADRLDLGDGLLGVYVQILGEQIAEQQSVLRALEAHLAKRGLAP
jgi:hypothetical protein